MVMANTPDFSFVGPRVQVLSKTIFHPITRCAQATHAAGVCDWLYSNTILERTFRRTRRGFSRISDFFFPEAVFLTFSSFQALFAYRTDNIFPEDSISIFQEALFVHQTYTIFQTKPYNAIEQRHFPGRYPLSKRCIRSMSRWLLSTFSFVCVSLFVLQRSGYSCFLKNSKEI